ncbi:MAG: TolC family protein [Desulfuromonas sp.]|nr:MAG: TolC family protein [Desulfuromonas sp.]
MIFSTRHRLGLIGGAIVLFAAATALAAPVSLDSLVAEGLQNNPELHAAEARWQQAERKAIPVDTLPDPVLSFAFMNYPVGSLDGDETPMTGKDLRLAQKFPYPGKLGEKRKQAEHQAAWLAGVYADGKLQLEEKIRTTWYQIWFQERAIELVGKNLRLLDDFIQLTESRYAVGKGLQQDVLKAQVERSKLMDRDISLRQQKESSEAMLARLLGRNETGTIDVPRDIELTPVDISPRQLRQAAKEQRPLVAAFQALIEKAKSERDLAKLDYRPDFTLWAGYRFREDVMGDPVDGEDFVSAGISLNLPLWQEKRHEQVAGAESAIREANARLESFRVRVGSEIDSLLYQVRKNRDLADLFNGGIIPQADQTFQAGLTAYQVDKIEFLSLLDALMKLYRYQIDYHRAVADHQITLAKLAAVSGLSWDDLSNGNLSAEK